MITEPGPIKFEILAAALGVGVGALGAVFASPLVLGMGTAVAAVATGMRVYDRGAKTSAKL